MEKQRKVKRLIVMSGVLILLVLGSTAYSAKQTIEPVESTQVETTVTSTEVIETIEDDGEIGLTADGETVYSFGKYGELGKTVFDNFASAWVKGIITDEASLREIMDLNYGDLSNKEELTQEILAMERDPQTQVAEEAQPSTQESKPATQPTKPTSTTPTKSANESNSNNSTPTTVSQEQNIPAPTSSTWTPEQEAEAQAWKQEAKEKQSKPSNNGVSTDPNQDFDSAAGQWDWD